MLFDQALTKLESIFHHQQLNLPNYQQRQIPIYVAGVQTESAYHIGKQGRYFMALPFHRSTKNPDAIAEILTQYHHGWQQSARAQEHTQCIMNLFVHVAKSDQQAKTNIASAFGRYMLTRGLETEIQSKTKLATIYDQWNEQGYLLSGSVETVTEKLDYFQNFGGLTDPLIEQLMDLFANQVMKNINQSK